MVDYNDVLDEIAKEFSCYDKLDLVSKLSSLRLLPQNGDHTIRLDGIVHAAASNSSVEAKVKINKYQLNKIVNSPKVKNSYLRHAEDPKTQLLCEEISFFGGGYRIFTGAYDSISYNFRALLKTLFLTQEKYLSKELWHELFIVVKVILAISEKIASRANIKRNTDTVFYEDIFIPSKSELDKFASTVKFTEEEFSSLLSQYECEYKQIEWLIVDCAMVDLKKYSTSAGPLLDSPIIKLNNHFIISDPSSLLASFGKKCLNKIIDANELEDFKKAYKRSVWSTIISNLKLMGITKVEAMPSRVYEDLPVVDGVFSFEQNKALIAFLITDSFENNDQECIEIDLVGSQDKIDSLANMLCLIDNPPDEIFYLFITSHYYRAISYSLFIPPYNSRSLILSADSLDIISKLEGGKNNFLYKYSLAQEKLDSKTEIVAFNQLTEYGFFRSKDYSYYLGDDIKLDMLHLTDDIARSVRQEALELMDRHCVYNPIKNSYVDVISLHGRDLPLYIPHYIPSYIEILLEGLTIPFWFYNYDLTGYKKIIAIEIVDMIGYWLNELSGELKEILSDISKSINYLKIKIDLMDNEEWTNPKMEENATVEEAIMATSITQDEVQFFFKPISNGLLYGETNIGERNIMNYLLFKIGEHFNEFSIPNNLVNQETVYNIIDSKIPLGRKKKLCTYDTSNIIEIDPRGITGARLDYGIDVNLLLDEIGENALVQSLDIGKTPKEQVQFINKHIVGFLWIKLIAIIKTFEIEELLLYLLDKSESIIRKKKLDEIQLPMRLEIADSHRVLKEFNKSRGKLTEAGIANRFLIECAVGHSPRGLQPMNDSVYDELLAIATQIISWGFTSDLIHENIGEMNITLLTSGRIGRTKENYEKAQSRFSSQVVEQHISSLQKRFPQNWQVLEKDNQDGDDSFISQFNTAFKEEFGFEFYDLIDFEKHLFSISGKNDSSIIKISENQLVHELVQLKSMAIEVVHKLIKYLSLEFRKEYFSYPEYSVSKKYDFYPWRFSRRISYVRRPLLKIKLEDETYFYYGIRHLKVAVDNFIALCYNGRLQNEVKTIKLKQLLSKLNSPSGNAFNEDVAEVFYGNKRYEVHKQVKKFGKTKIEYVKGEELGDIDVMVIDKRKNKLFLIECKDFLMARTPYELSMEYKEVFESDNSYINKFSKRVKWIKENIDEVIKHYMLDNEKKWKIKSMMVVNEPLFSSHFRSQNEMDIMTLNELKQKFK